MKQQLEDQGQALHRQEQGTLTICVSYQKLQMHASIEMAMGPRRISHKCGSPETEMKCCLMTCHLRAALRRAFWGSLGPCFSLCRRLRLSMIQSANAFWALLSSRPPSSRHSYEASDSGSEKSSGSESDSCCFLLFLTGPGHLQMYQPGACTQGRADKSLLVTLAS